MQDCVRHHTGRGREVETTVIGLRQPSPERLGKMG